MKFSVDKHEKYVTIKLNESKFTNDNTPALKSEFVMLNNLGFRNIIIDISSVKECTDSQDLSSLLAGDRLCSGAGGLFLVCSPSEKVSEILVISNLDEQLNIVPSVPEATDLIFMHELEKELRGE